MRCRLDSFLRFARRIMGALPPIASVLVPYLGDIGSLQVQ